MTGDGRARDAREVALHRKAQQIGLMLLAQHPSPLTPVMEAEIAELPRSELRRQRENLRRVREEVRRFCRMNFPNATVERLARLHDEVLGHGSTLRVPMSEFIRRLGPAGAKVLRGAPAHATANISPLGLQFDFPEMHHVRDLASAFAEVIESQRWYEERQEWSLALTKSRDPEARRRITRYRFALRMTMLVCFNLVESYVNGLSFEFVQRKGTAGLTPKDVNLLTESERPVNTVEKLVKVPRLVGGLAEPPLHDSREPLRMFIEFVKPYRDSIVHASPFSAPERFGGYDKLEKFWDLDGATVSDSVKTTLWIVSRIHRALGGEGLYPQWIDDFPQGPFQSVIEPWFKAFGDPEDWARGKVGQGCG